MTRMRVSADERRVQAVSEGLNAFADHGMTTAATQRVADRMGVSPPYVFRLFGSNRAFFLACIDTLPMLIIDMFQRSTQDAQEPMEAMGAGFRTLVSDVAISGFWLQACAAARADDEIASRCRDVIAKVLQVAQASTGANPEELAVFFGRGALVMMFQTLGIDLRRGTQAAVASMVEGG